MPHPGEYVVRDEGDWITPTLINAWVDFNVAFSPAGYYKDSFGIVRLRGIIRSGAVGSAAFVLPAGFRPAFRELHGTISNDLIGGAEINPNGNVLPVVGSNVYFSLEGITFKAAQ